MPYQLLLITFSEIGNAYAVLSNPEKRKQYDLTGNEEQACNHQNNGRFNFHRGCEADITPEDLFNIFFGGGFPSGILMLVINIIFYEARESHLQVGYVEIYLRSPPHYL